jgi:hypothetical protein
MPPTTLSKPDLPSIPRAISAFHLEGKLVEFIRQLFTDTYLLDNPKVNQYQTAQDEWHDLPQPDVPAHPIVPPTVPYDYTGRAQSLLGKVPPMIVRGRVPRTVTGEIDPNQLPDFPSIAVQVTEGKVETHETHVTVRIFFHAYDENPNSQGYQDVLTMTEVVAYALTSYGQKGIDNCYVIMLPFEWRIPEGITFPHFIGEMLTKWKLPSARPLPDYDTMLPIPAEHIDLRASALTHGLVIDGVELPDTPPDEIPPEPPAEAFIETLTSNKFSPSDDRISLSSHSLTINSEVRFSPVTDNDVLPTPIDAARYYFVIDTRVNDFRISTTQGGSPVDITDKGTGSFDLWLRQ